MESNIEPSNSAPTSDDVFASSFRVARTQRGLSQADVTLGMIAQGFDWNQTTVSKVERGQRRVTVGEAVALAKMVDSTVDHLGSIDRTSIDYKMHMIQSRALYALIALDQAVDAARTFTEAHLDLVSALADLGDDEKRIRMPLEGGVVSPLEFYGPLIKLNRVANDLVFEASQLTEDPKSIEMLHYLKYRPERLNRSARKADG